MYYLVRLLIFTVTFVLVLIFPSPLTGVLYCFWQVYFVFSFFKKEYRLTLFIGIGYAGLILQGVLGWITHGSFVSLLTTVLYFTIALATLPQGCDDTK